MESQPPGGALFSAVSREQQAALLAAEREEQQATARSALLARAAGGDVKVLDEAARAEDASLYDELLAVLVDGADSDAKLLSLVSHIARTEGLRVNRKLAAKFLESWKREPGRATTARALHIVALSGDAALYGEAIEAIAESWRAGRVPGLLAAELRQLIESEYWVLPAASRSSGAGFLMKRTMAELRRQLTASTGHQS